MLQAARILVVSASPPHTTRCSKAPADVRLPNAGGYEGLPQPSAGWRPEQHVAEVRRGLFLHRRQRV